MKKLNPIEQSEYIENKFREYIQSTFQIEDEVYEKEFIEELKQAEICKGPYISTALPFVKAHTIKELVEQGKISKEFLKLSKIDFDRKLYLHQEKSIELISKGHNAVITTGTGSGKTESFLYPILNHILKEIESGKGGSGIVALFLYPMNALVNDQIDRVRDILRNYPQITFGFFTGDTAENDTVGLREKLSEKYGTIIPENEIVSREEIRRNTPNLFFTNYSMLEHLLIRPSDFNIFNNDNIVRWQFVVLDEAHTYTGALGIELALLLRRVKGIAKRNPQFLLTSATLGDENKDIDKIIRFAENLTTSNFEKEDIVFSKREKLFNKGNYSIDSNKYKELVDNMENVEFPKIVRSIDQNINVNQNQDEIFYDLLISDTNVRKLYDILNTNKSKTFKEIYSEVSNLINITKQQLVDLIFIISKASKNNETIFDSKYHTFIRTLDGAYISLAKNKKMKLTNCKTIDDMTAFEIGLCKYCNEMYIMGKKLIDKNGLVHLHQNSDVDIDENYGEIEENDVKVDYFLLKDITKINEKHIDDVTEEIVCSKCGAIYNPKDLNAKKCKCGSQYEVKLLKVNNDKGARNNLTTCPCCNRTSRNSVGVVSGFHLSKDSATALLSQILYETLECKEEKNKSKEIKVSDFWSTEPDEDIHNIDNKKTKQFIAFSDSRQQASFFATFYEYTHKRFLRKRILWEMLKDNNHEPITCTSLLTKLKNIIYNEKLFEVQDDIENSEKEAWIAILSELLNIDGNYTAEGLGIFYFKLNEEEIKHRIKEAGVPLEPFLIKYQLTETEFYDILQVLFQVFRNTAALNYEEANIDLNTRKEEFSFRRFDNYVVEKRDNLNKNEQIKGENRTSFLPANEKIVTKIYNYIEKIFHFSKEQTNEFLSFIFKFGKNFIFKEIQGDKEKLYQIEAKKYQLNSYIKDKFYVCPVCKKVTPYNVRGICPSKKCNGKLEECDLEEHFKNNYYRKEYMNKTIENIVVKEHTAQIDRDKGRQYQNDFKEQKINVLSCSTTFEMGIDIGKLENVFLRNVPPTPANYAQRAGRAGRSKDSSAFVLTFCGTSSHDFTYFKDPSKMISGVVTPPNFKVTNEKILIRHITASAFGFFFRKYPEYFENVESLICNGGIKKFMDYLESKPEELKEYIDGSVLDNTTMQKYGNFAWVEKLTIKDGTLDNYYTFSLNKIEELEKAMNMASNISDFSTANYYKSEIKKEKRKRVIESLSEFCVIPKYGFPVDVVDLKVYEKNGRLNTNYNLSRDLSLAISEYAPDSEIIVDNKKYTSRYIIKPRGDADLTRFYYFTCPDCDRINISNIKDKLTNCQYCNSIYNSPIVDYFIEPIYGFATDTKNKESTTKKPKKTYAGEYKYLGEGISNNDKFSFNDYVFVESTRDDELLVMNSNPFYRCKLCGYSKLILNKNGLYEKESHKNYMQYNCDNDLLEKTALGHTFKTDVVKINIANLTEKRHALSTLYALLEGISGAFDIERKDINGIINKNELGVYEIIIFDNVPGGAGHVKRILDKESLKEAFLRAYEKVNGNCCDEETSCYNCLRNYNNQKIHNELKRRYAKEVLKEVIDNINGVVAGKEDIDLIININNSYSLSDYNVWEEVQYFIEGIDIEGFINKKIRIPDYATSIIKLKNKEIQALAIWQNEKIILFNNDTNDIQLKEYSTYGWNCYKIDSINYDKIKEVMERSKNG